MTVVPRDGFRVEVELPEQPRPVSDDPVRVGTEVAGAGMTGTGMSGEGGDAMMSETNDANNVTGAVRVMVVDDQTLVRQGIRTLLEIGGINVIAEAGDGKEALDKLSEIEVDVVLLDLRMPQYDGLWFLREVASPDKTAGSDAATVAEDPSDTDVPVLVLTTFDDDNLMLDALRHGARAYMLKASPSTSSPPRCGRWPAAAR